MFVGAVARNDDVFRYERDGCLLWKEMIVVKGANLMRMMRMASFDNAMERNWTLKIACECGWRGRGRGRRVVGGRRGREKFRSSQQQLKRLHNNTAGAHLDDKAREMVPEARVRSRTSR